MQNIKKEITLLQDEFNSFIPELLNSWTPEGVILATKNLVHYKLSKHIVKLSLTNEGVKFIGNIEKDGTENDFSSVYYVSNNKKEYEELKNMFLSFVYVIDKRRNKLFKPEKGIFDF